MRSRKDVQQLMQQIFEECQAVREDRQKAYAHNESNALSNFERTGIDLGIAREKVWYIFAKKHWDGVLSWINGQRNLHESVRGRIKDLIVYLVLLWAMVDDTEEGVLHKTQEIIEADVESLESGAIALLLEQGYTITKAN